MKKYYIILLIIIGVSCSREEENLEPININLVTGIDIKEFQESSPMRLGNPNTLNYNKFIIFPNPVRNNLRIKSIENMTDIWVLPATASKSYKGTDFQKLLNSELYSEKIINDKSILKFNDLEWTEISLPTESLNSGYYKVFVKINGNIFWDNIYVSNIGSDLNDLINYWK